MDYTTQLLQPQWLELREQIIVRDKRCQCCNAKHDLQVHHRAYKPDTMAWDYEHDWLVTYCDTCHKRLHDEKDSLSRVIGWMSATEIHELWYIHTQLFPKDANRIRFMREYSGQLQGED